MGIVADPDGGCSSPDIPLKGPTQGLTQTHSLELQCWVSSLKGTGDIQGGLNCLVSVPEPEKQLSPTQSAGRGHCSFSESSPQPRQWNAPHLSLHRPGHHCAPHTVDSLRPHPTQLLGPPKRLPAAFPHKQPFLAHASDFPKISQTRNIWPQHALYLLLSGPRPGTNGSRPWFAAWPLLGSSKPSTSSSRLQVAL